jgi:hypothetical protein
MHARKVLLPTAILLAGPLLTVAVASAAPALRTDQACYLVRQRVGITGSGFAPARAYQVAVDGLDFGIGTTDAGGGFTASLIPGGIGANIVQVVHHLTASDGTSTSKAVFTVTRATGARILAGSGTVATFRARFQIWGFSILQIVPPPYSTFTPGQVYVHYVSPHKHLRTTVALGSVSGQCGYLKTAKQRVFPFIPTRGVWTLQLDSVRRYSSHPVGPVARIALRVA